MVRARRGLPPLEDDGSDQGNHFFYPPPIFFFLESRFTSYLFVQRLAAVVSVSHSNPRNPARSTATNQRYTIIPFVAQIKGLCFPLFTI